GPALHPLLLPHVQALPEINPILRSLQPNDDPSRHHIKWDILFTSSHAGCSHDVSVHEWIQYLFSPATFPRLREITLVSRSLPWTIHVSAKNVRAGVTCGDVLHQIYAALHKFAVHEDKQKISPADYEGVVSAAQANRRRKNDSGEFLIPYERAAMRRVDWLGRATIFAGLDRDEVHVADRFGAAMPAVFILQFQETAIAVTTRNDGTPSSTLYMVSSRPHHLIGRVGT
ncbi:hypothetical protein PLICRDRAFT_109167, partial [Plicaturopsis crispa FD-325 SS-3]